MNYKNAMEQYERGHMSYRTVLTGLLKGSIAAEKHYENKWQQALRKSIEAHGVKPIPENGEGLYTEDEWIAYLEGRAEEAKAIVKVILDVCPELEAEVKELL